VRLVGISASCRNLDERSPKIADQMARALKSEDASSSLRSDSQLGSEAVGDVLPGPACVLRETFNRMATVTGCQLSPCMRYKRRAFGRSKPAREHLIEYRETRLPIPSAAQPFHYLRGIAGANIGEGNSSASQLRSGYSENRLQAKRTKKYMHAFPSARAFDDCETVMYSGYESGKARGGLAPARHLSNIDRRTQTDDEMGMAGRQRCIDAGR
jgi:hypothetical protein